MKKNQDNQSNKVYKSKKEKEDKTQIIRFGEFFIITN